MNIFTSNFNRKLVPMSPLRSPPKMHFHHAASPMFLPAPNPCRTFSNPNIFDQNTYEVNFPSSYRKTNHFEVIEHKETDKQEKSENSSSMISEELEKPDLNRVIFHSSESASSRKRAHKSKKSSEKHNRDRQLLNEMMDVDFSNDSTDYSLSPGGEDKEMETGHPSSVKLCDILLLPNHSSPIGVPIVNISMNSTKIPSQNTCLAFSISPPCIRQRQLSTTESEDSFIVFDSGTDDECDFSEEAGSESDFSEEENCDDESDTDSPSSIIPTKKVRFAMDKELCEVHPMIQWSFAYQAARKGPWEVYARDRERFKNRIKEVGDKIGHCFEPEHRQKVYDQRFQQCSEE